MAYSHKTAEFIRLVTYLRIAAGERLTTKEHRIYQYLNAPSRCSQGPKYKVN